MFIIKRTEEVEGREERNARSKLNKDVSWKDMQHQSLLSMMHRWYIHRKMHVLKISLTSFA